MNNKLKIDLHSQNVVRRDLAVSITKPVFAEVLARIHKDGLKLHTQTAILDFERSNFIIKFDLYILKQVTKFILDCKLKGYNIETKLSVNISGKTINQKPYEVLEIIKDVADFLIIEVTETVRANLNKAQEFSNMYKGINGLFAIDDFNDFNETCDEKYRIELLDATKPSIVKLTTPKFLYQYEDFGRLMKIVISIHQDNLLVFEQIESHQEWVLLSERYNNSLFQGFYFAKGTSLINNLHYEH